MYIWLKQRKMYRKEKKTADLLADKFEYNSSAKNYSTTFQNYKHNHEKKMNTSDNAESYNNPFSITELEDSLI